MNERKEISKGLVASIIIFGVIFIIALFKSFYLQDVGEVVVVPQGSTPMVQVGE